MTPIAYSVTVENTGDIEITSLVVIDDRDGSFASPFPTTLAAGASETRTFTSTITLADAAAGNVDNTASVTDRPARGDDDDPPSARSRR